jgi:L-ascorbate metabolism protein UlaG (beta-lactamase superfamily)
MLRRIAIGLGALLLAGAGVLAWAWNDRPEVAVYDELLLPVAEPAHGALRVTFLGVSTLLFDDGDSAVLIDGFFSRPPLLLTAFGRIGPDEDAISRALEDLGIEKLDAVVTVHSHYDHAMDSPEVARRTGAKLVGSISTAWIARGQDLPERFIEVVRGGETLTFGNFEIVMLPTRHVPHGQGMGALDEALVPPARALDYLEGGSFGVFLRHGDRRVLVQGSAGYVEGAFDGERADVVFLGVGLLGTSPADYRSAYWRETVAAVGARRVIPIHWDDFTKPFGAPLVALPRLLDDLDVSMDFLRARGVAEGVELRMIPFAEPTDPFAGMVFAGEEGAEGAEGEQRATGQAP